MGTRKNIKFLTPTEQEAFVKACVLMKADIVNPGAAPASQYSKWDEYVAIHAMIQNGFAPGIPFVNFGHGGSGRYSFLSWHRYFLYQFEQDLQSYVPGVMMPYWDWTDPAAQMTETFLGPNGNAANNNVIERGYFAVTKPGVGANTTALPAWWPATLSGWTMPSMFAATFQGGLRRQTRPIAQLPTPNNVRDTLAKPDYHNFQLTLETGISLVPANQMHNAMHGWIGGGTSGTVTQGHMGSPAVSPFDPFFYLHHCNIDRLWAMWQMDGHASEYPAAGGTSGHNRNDIMYPWTGGTVGYGTNDSLSMVIPMPDYSAIGVKRNVDTLDFRAAFGYTYDTLPIVGVGLDRTGSMNGLTPDPMTVGAPDVTKWEAAKRGVSAFLQDCETVQASGVVYTTAGIKTFRSLGANDFQPVFGAPTYGLIKTGTSFSRATFDSNIAAMTPGGGTPLADALLDVQNTLVDPPFMSVPTDERRYIAMLTDGILTTGSPMATIPDGSLSRTAVFGMGFGTGLEVDYATIASLVAKGQTLSTPQIFHGENAGTIDKFFSNTLASAIGFTSVFDPVIELFAGEHTHLSFVATSAEDVFYLTAQGMDFDDANWSFMLHGPDGSIMYGDAEGHSSHVAGCHHCCVLPDITSKRSNGRLTIVIQRGNCDLPCWVGNWTLMITYKAKMLDKMMMPEAGELLFPVAAGPIKGPRYVRLLTSPRTRVATRNMMGRALHGLDTRAVSTNSDSEPACSMVVNVYARTQLQVSLEMESTTLRRGEPFKLTVNGQALAGALQARSGFARLVAPAVDLFSLVPRDTVTPLILAAEKTRKYSRKLDIALLLASLEKKNKQMSWIDDQALRVVQHGSSPLHIHHEGFQVPGTYHIGLLVDGLYYPSAAAAKPTDGHDHGSHEPMPIEGAFEPFSRLLNLTFTVV